MADDDLVCPPPVSARDHPTRGPALCAFSDLDELFSVSRPTVPNIVAKLDALVHGGAHVVRQGHDALAPHFAEAPHPAVGQAIVAPPCQRIGAPSSEQPTVAHDGRAAEGADVSAIRTDRDPLRWLFRVGGDRRGAGWSARGRRDTLCSSVVGHKTVAEGRSRALIDKAKRVPLPSRPRPNTNSMVLWVTGSGTQAVATLRA
jgi:hypothetical protein